MAQGGMGSDPRAMDADATGAEGERADGRPEGAPAVTPADTGRPSELRDASAATSTRGEETEAAEEQGDQPATEHAPGADL